MFIIELQCVKFWALFAFYHKFALFTSYHEAINQHHFITGVTVHFTLDSSERVIFHSLSMTQIQWEF
jgi:hypothetical protein